MRCLNTVRVVAVVLVLGVGSAVAGSDRSGEPRTISVRGRAELLFPADHVVIRTSVVAEADAPKDAQAEASAKAARVLGFVHALGVDDRDVVTDGVSLQETTQRFNDDDDCPKVEPEPEYTAVVGIRITLRDIARYDELMAGLLDLGVNRIRGASFESTEMPAKAREARVAAIRAAREKAVYLAEELGERVGRPLDIEEVSEESVLGYSVGYSNTYQIQGMSSAGGSAGSSISPRQLTVTAEIDVVFELVGPEGTGSLGASGSSHPS